MKRRSKKTQAAYDLMATIREDYCIEHDCLCIWCGTTPVSVHEIARGIHRSKAFCDPCCWLPLCWICNSGQFNDKSKWPEAKQLCLKKHRDFKYYDLPRYNMIVNFGSDRITAQDVEAYDHEVQAAKKR